MWSNPVFEATLKRGTKSIFFLNDTCESSLLTLQMMQSQFALQILYVLYITRENSERLKVFRKQKSLYNYFDSAEQLNDATFVVSVTNFLFNFSALCTNVVVLRSQDSKFCN